MSGKESRGLQDPPAYNQANVDKVDLESGRPLNKPNVIKKPPNPTSHKISERRKSGMAESGYFDAFSTEYSNRFMELRNYYLPRNVVVKCFPLYILANFFMVLVGIFVVYFVFFYSWVSSDSFFSVVLIPSFILMVLLCCNPRFYVYGVGLFSILVIIGVYFISSIALGLFCTIIGLIPAIGRFVRNFFKYLEYCNVQDVQESFGFYAGAFVRKLFSSGSNFAYIIIASICGLLFDLFIEFCSLEVERLNENTNLPGLSRYQIRDDVLLPRSTTMNEAIELQNNSTTQS
ncbi:hypothetical protein SPOG_02382 [Schizosaccharomyces cryophilus OY26]|uniref:Uncharacterized protein n=1 Tax=Schizosaccharomyces cryophilus (strain OY26 / ATCC MYA-4695 / CBS 11777 / NBRC 106824 / NRRL Y48691) TaxID=653667 RepID=S9XBM4_SCHCR|nr:uncharacterized protein SPOG_02382 [Schizosaccharomyces cryophilus OY26]EPY51206.1 hypothetical protein SPOG_02382 [Schizosaccharomyces cryophilus OY26]